MSRELKIPVLPLVASKGRGVRRWFLKSVEVVEVNLRAGEEMEHRGLNAAERHIIARQLANSFVSHTERRVTWRDRLDDALLHPVWGYFILAMVLFGFFQIVYGIGKIIEPPLLEMFDWIMKGAVGFFDFSPLLSEDFTGVIQGVAAGMGEETTRKWK